MKTPLVTILSYEIKKKIEATHLTKIQKLICKWFHITPEKRYNYTLGITIENNCQIMVGDNILLQDQTQWLTTKKVGNYVELNNFVSLISLSIQEGDQMIIYGSSYCEGTGSPS